MRLGKGRQKGATYFNEDVIYLQDILRLKRRNNTISSSSSSSYDETNPTDDFDFSETGQHDHEEQHSLVDTFPVTSHNVVTLTRKSCSHCSPPKLRRQRQLRKRPNPSSNVETRTISPIIHPADKDYVEHTPSSKKSRLSAVNRALHLPCVVSAPVSPSESGDERENRFSMISRENSNSSFCTSQLSKSNLNIGMTALSCLPSSLLLQPLSFPSSTPVVDDTKDAGFLLQRDDLLVCAALVHLGQFSPRQVAAGHQ